MGVVCGRGSGRERPAGWGWGALGWRSRFHAPALALGGSTTFVHTGGLGLLNLSEHLCAHPRRGAHLISAGCPDSLEALDDG